MNSGYSYDGYDDKIEPISRFSMFQKYVSIQFKMGNILELQGCKKCKGNGLRDSKIVQGCEYDYCPDCKGTGVKKLELKPELGMYVCKKCNGYAYINGTKCKNCKGIGIVDWIDNIIEGVCI